MKAVEISSIDFSCFGILYDMTVLSGSNLNINHSSGVDWKDSNTTIPIIDTLAHIGYTIGSGCPFTTTMMEKHQHTQEALFCAGNPIIFLLGEDLGKKSPNAKDIIPVILRPGQIAVLHRNVWHSSAHGLINETAYYYLALCYKNEPTEWKEISNGPVAVEV
jgi:ureidoglycolate lyase